MSAFVPERELKRLREAILKRADARLNDYADYILEESQNNIVLNKTSNTGFLAGTGNASKTEFLKKTVSYSAQYAPFIEWGTQPHYVAPEHLVRWVELKLGKSGLEAWNTARAISYKILREGTEPQPFLMPALDSLVVRLGK